MIDEKNKYQQVKSNKVTYEKLEKLEKLHMKNIWKSRKITTGQGDDYTTGCLFDYAYFKKYYKMIATDLSKQQSLDADHKAIQQINFTENLYRAGNTRFYFVLQETNETVFEFLQGTL